MGLLVFKMDQLSIWSQRVLTQFAECREQVMLSALLVAIGLCAAVVVLSVRDLQRRPSELIQVRTRTAYFLSLSVLIVFLAVFLCRAMMLFAFLGVEVVENCAVFPDGCGGRGGQRQAAADGTW